MKNYLFFLHFKMFDDKEFYADGIVSSCFFGIPMPVLVYCEFKWRLSLCHDSRRRKETLKQRIKAWMGVPGTYILLINHQILF